MLGASAVFVELISLAGTGGGVPDEHCDGGNGGDLDCSGRHVLVRPLRGC